MPSASRSTHYAPDERLWYPLGRLLIVLQVRCVLDEEKHNAFALNRNLARNMISGKRNIFNILYI